MDASIRAAMDKLEKIAMAASGRRENQGKGFEPSPNNEEDT